MPPTLHQSTDWGRSFTTPQGATGLGPFTPGQPSLEVTVAELAVGKLIQVPELVTVTLTRRVLTRTLSAGNSGRLLARVKYGVGAANDEILFDWNYGTSFVLPLSPESKVLVNALQIDATPTGGGNPDIPETFTLTAMVSRGARQSIEPPTLTYTVDVAAVGTTTIKIPNRAKRVVVQPQLGFASTLVASLVTHNTTTPFSAAIAADAQLRTTGVVIPGNVFQLNLSGGGVACPGVQVCFLLDG